MRTRVRRPTIRRAVVQLPNGFTLFNLFCGIFAIVLASRLNFGKAALFVFLGGIADALDGRVARATGSGSRFGEELDSLVDAISFGFAPAMIMYFAVLNTENWEWLFVFLYTGSAVVRLARFNVEQAGRAKTYFHGLPSPAAGLTLATYYWFSQTPLYNQAIIRFTDNKTLSELPWHTILPGLMGLLAVLMVSNVPYPAVPTIGWRSFRQIVASLVLIASIVGLIFLPRQFFFPAMLAYVLYGALKWLVLGLIGAGAEPEEIYFQLDPEEELAAAVPSSTLRRTPSLGTAALAASAPMHSTAKIGRCARSVLTDRLAILPIDRPALSRVRMIRPPAHQSRHQRHHQRIFPNESLSRRRSHRPASRPARSPRQSCR